MFLVIEIQTNPQDQVATIVNSYEDENQAWSKYHDVLHFAAVSTTLKKHACAIITEEGFHIKDECFTHEISGGE